MKTIYLDMDDVIADFKAYAKRVLTEPQNNETWAATEWNRLKDNDRLYNDLDKTPEADRLVEECVQICKQNNWQLKFLTAVPKGNDVRWAFYDKVLWAQRHYPGIPVMFGPFSKDKHVHCVPGDVLIDDRTSNCEEWRAVGGIAIQHRGDIERTLQELRLVS
jgi:5'(3')-deoxyribonucleotidase